jgi:hypothetical protein
VYLGHFNHVKVGTERFIFIRFRFEIIMFELKKRDLLLRIQNSSRVDCPSVLANPLDYANGLFQDKQIEVANCAKYSFLLIIQCVDILI